MKIPQVLPRAAVLFTIGLAASIWVACSDQPFEPLAGPSARQQAPIDRQAVGLAVMAQQRHAAELFRVAGVVGTAVGLGANGRPVVRVFLTRAGVSGLPVSLDGVPVATEVTGRFMALSDPTHRQRPAPLGYSVGHPAITAGSIGARVVDGSGNVYILSNNHVLANSNDASIGDPEYQPGPFDGGTEADQIATLAAFQPIDFTGGNNTFDAAIALSNPADLDNASPTDDGYGAPSAQIFGDANHDGVFDNKNDLLGLSVQKFGRTTKLTQGQITGINATVDVCYEVLFNIFCIKSARFVDQIIIQPGGFSGGGDSGSLIVTADGNNPVALLFAGSSTQTIANRIDLVLNHFGVSVDGGSSPPPTPLTDVAVTGVSGPASVTQGNTASIAVTVRNVGNQDVAASFDVTLHDATDNVDIGTQSIAGLSAGATATPTFNWNTAGSTTGSHTLTASHTFADENAANDQASTAITVNPPGTSGTMHVGDLDGSASRSGNRWAATVEITVHDGNHNPLNGAVVRGSWSQSGLNADTCTTGELGGNGSCIVLFPGLRRGVLSVSFTVTSVTLTGRTYQASANHDVDGSSNGTTVTVQRP